MQMHGRIVDETEKSNHKGIDIMNANRPDVYGLKLARDILKNGKKALAQDAALLDMIFALPSPKKEEAFVAYALTGQAPAEVDTAAQHRVAA